MSSISEESPIVTVLFDFEYTTDDGRHIQMSKGERLSVINKTNNDWWKVMRPDECHDRHDRHDLKRRNGDDGSDISAISNDMVNVNIDNNRSECDDYDCNDSNDDSVSVPFYAPVSYLTIADHSNNSDNQTSDPSIGKHKTTIKVGLCFTNPLSSGFATDGTDSSKESLIDDDTGNCDNISNKRNYKLSKSKSEVIRHPSSTMSSPIYANLKLLAKNRPSPPVPNVGLSPIRILLNHWAEYEDESGRKYYYNSLTRECSWKPPRRKAYPTRDDDIGTSHSEENLTDSSSASIPTNKCLSSSPTHPKTPKSRIKKLAKHINAIGNRSSIAEGNNNKLSLLTLPKGWTRQYNTDAKELYFVNDKTNEKWFCKVDENGRIYFFEENGQESYWELPDLNVNENETPKIIVSSSAMDDSGITVSGASSDSLSPNSPKDTVKGRMTKLSSNQRSLLERNIKSRSMAFLPISNTLASGPNIPAILLQDNGQSSRNEQLRPKFHPPPPLIDDSVKIIKQGLLNRTKLVEGGKRIRKNWAQSHVVLTDYYVLFFKDNKIAQSGGKPEIIIELVSAMLTWSLEKSSRKNCFQISTIPGQQILLQEDCLLTCKQWFDAIRNAIKNAMPSPFHIDESDHDTEAKGAKLKRSKSTKQYRPRELAVETEKFLPLMISQSATNIPPDRRKKIRDRLRQFLRRRPTIETLREKGIFKDEPVFGGKLEHLCIRDKQTVPKFVHQCIKAIEEKDLTADGLYRACGNLSQVQKLRFQINQDDFSGIWAEDDVHVLTGLLKMFFRDMKEPLFPCNRFEELMKIIVLPERKSKLEALTKLIKELPRPNHDTLNCLLQHLLRVKEHSDENRMHIQNLAIVFGPTLMWPENDSNNFALDMMLRMHQNQIIEFLLLEYDNLFR